MVMKLKWEPKLFGEVVKLQRGFDLPSRLRKPGLIPVVSSSGIIAYHHHTPVFGPGVITGRYGTIGEIFFVIDDYWPLNTTLFVADFKGNFPLFIYYLLHTIDFKNYSGKSGVPGVNRNDLYYINISIPPVEEQQVIAKALSDVDDLIDGLERLIAKKRDIKTATMQQLLIGKKRLPGFGGDWEMKCLGDGVELHSGHHVLAQHCNTQSEGIPYLTGPADFPEGRISHTKFTTRPSIICSPGDILVTVKGSGSGAIVLADAEYCISRQLMAIRVNDWNVHFVYYSLLQNAEQFKTVSTGLIPGLSRSDILEQPLPIPPTHKEQTAIAKVLMDMDAELAVLEQRFNKTKSIKQGMMQELLTGRTRLI